MVEKLRRRGGGMERLKTLLQGRRRGGGMERLKTILQGRRRGGAGQFERTKDGLKDDFNN